MTTLRKSLLIYLYYFSICALTTQHANAHQVEIIYLEIDAQADQWQAVVFFDAAYALPEMRADKNAPQPKREWLVNRSKDQLVAIRNGAETYLRECLVFELIKTRGPPETLNYTVDFPDFATDPPSFPTMLTGGAYMHVRLSGTIPVGTLQIRVRNGERPSFTVDFEEEASLVSPGNHRSLFTKAAGSNEVKIVETSHLERTWGFIKLGFEHVLPDGMDHILFIIGLFIAALKLRALIHLSLMFTIAHSLTLGLMLCGIIQLSDALIIYIVEPFIALSIAWIALEHLFWKEGGKRARLYVVFLFGLIHGLGFASSLQQGLKMDDGWALPLISANIGIEIAQLLILAICVILFHRHLSKRWFSQLRTITSYTIGMIGIWWFFSRIFDI